MLTKREGRNYVILHYGSHKPEKLNKNKVDKSIDKIEKAAKTIESELMALYENDYEIYQFIRDNIFDCYSTSLEDGRCGFINDLLWNIDNTKEVLSTDDEIKPEEELITLLDIGYKDSTPWHPVWEKEIEESDEKSVTEEIQMVDGEPLRRIRTTYWEKIEGGRASTEITYRKLPIGKNLMKIIHNTYYGKSED